MAAQILLVDDDQDFLDLQESILSAAGYTTACFSDPRAALHAIADPAAGGKPRLVVTDLMMSALDAGFSLARTVKSDPRCAGVRVIIVSAVASQRGFNFSPSKPEDLAAMGADAFFDKPVQPVAFLDKVRELLG